MQTLADPRSADGGSIAAAVRGPYAVDEAVDWADNVISHWWECGARVRGDPSEFREQALGVEEPWIRQLLGRDSMRCVHNPNMDLSPPMEGTLIWESLLVCFIRAAFTILYDIYCLMLFRI